MATYDRLDKTGLRRFWDGIKAKLAEKAKITLTGVDPGEGTPLASGEYIAVYGEEAREDTVYIGSVLSTPSSIDYVATANIQDNAVTSDKIDFTTFYDVLYDGGTTGSNGTITLASNAANYARLKIFYRGNDNNQAFTEVLVDRLSLYVTLHLVFTTGTGRWDKTRLVTITGNTIKTAASWYYEAEFWGNYSQTNNIFIIRVEGWKF